MLPYQKLFQTSDTHLLDLKKKVRTSGCQRREKVCELKAEKRWVAPLKRSDAAEDLLQYDYLGVSLNGGTTKTAQNDGKPMVVG